MMGCGRGGGGGGGGVSNVQKGVKWHMKVSRPRVSWLTFACLGSSSWWWWKRSQFFYCHRSSSSSFSCSPFFLTLIWVADDDRSSWFKSPLSESYINIPLPLSSPSMRYISSSSSLASSTSSFRRAFFMIAHTYRHYAVGPVATN